MAFVFAPFVLLWRHRRLLWQTTCNDIRARYAGSMLGLVWLLLFPLLFLGIYAVVNLFIYQVRLGGMDTTGYLTLVFCGLIPFIGFSEALALGTSSVTGNASLIKNTLFPIELIPVKAVLTSQSTQVVGTGLLLIALAATGSLTRWALLLPALWLLQILLTLGVIWILSSLNVYFRDLQNTISLLNLMLMMVSPIAWTPDMIPARLRPLMGINPLYYLITCYQDALKIGQFPRGATLGVLVALAAVAFLGGYWFFTRMKSVFADNV
jgi:lipopolysaccharide transport system permease protein